MRGDQDEKLEKGKKYRSAHAERTIANDTLGHP